MRKVAIVLAVGSVVSLAGLPPTGASAAPAYAPRISAPAVQQVWYDRWGRWHPPAYRYGYAPPRYYPYGPPRPYGYRRAQCLRWGRC